MQSCLNQQLYCFLSSLLSNIASMREQLDSLGLCFNWDRVSGWKNCASHRDLSLFQNFLSHLCMRVNLAFPDRKWPRVYQPTTSGHSICSSSCLKQGWRIRKRWEWPLHWSAWPCFLLKRDMVSLTINCWGTKMKMRGGGGLKSFDYA